MATAPSTAVATPATAAPKAATPATAAPATAAPAKAAPKAAPAGKATGKAAPVAGKFVNHSRNAYRMPDLGNYKPGAKVLVRNKPGTWVVQGPAQGGTTLRVTQVQANGTKASLFRFARNLTPAPAPKAGK